MNKLTIKDIDLKGRRVFIRVDFNVPLDKTSGEISDDTRIKMALPTIKEAVKNGAKLILASHLGRPGGKIVEGLKMEPVGGRLEKLLGMPVKFAPDCIGPEVEKSALSLEEGEILLLENLRFHPEEEKNDASFSKKLAGLSEIYVNDAFGAAHRRHASTVGITKFSKINVAGLLMEKEILNLSKLTDCPEHPFVLILGGAKVSGKIDIIENLLDKVDTIILGGGMAYTFIKAKNWGVGNSLVEDDKIDLAKSILKKTRVKRIEFHTPLDHVIADKVSPEAQYMITERGAIPAGWTGVDIGPFAVQEYSECIERAKTIFWNGPMGVFEIDIFSKGTTAIAKEVAKARAYTVVGGGDSIAALNKAGLADKISHLSTGGGASLEFLSGEILPGIAVLENRTKEKARGGKVRRPLIAGNWKMYKTAAEGKELINQCLVNLKKVSDMEIMFAPPFTLLSKTADIIRETEFKLGAQNMYFESQGAYTGEISPLMLKDIGCQYVIIGHSERRKYFRESDGCINKKIRAALECGLTPVFCLGEKLSERENNSTEKIVAAQFKEGLRELDKKELAKIVIAYEPVWAIGTGKTATPAQAQEVHAFIRRQLKELFGREIAGGIRILYGGSVKPDNIEALIVQKDIDGVLVGGASLKSSDFSKIVLNAVNKLNSGNESLTG